jgi:hypothetical protein
MHIIYFYTDSKGVEYATPNVDWAVARAAYFGTQAYQKEINPSQTNARS